MAVVSVLVLSGCSGVTDDERRTFCESLGLKYSGDYNGGFSCYISDHKYYSNEVDCCKEIIKKEKCVEVKEHKKYEYIYCDFRERLDNDCKTFISPLKLEEFDTGAGWLRFKGGLE